MKHETHSATKSKEFEHTKGVIRIRGQETAS